MKTTQKKTLRCFTFLIFLLCWPTLSFSEDFETGVKAYLGGNYIEALRIWNPLADDGDEVAMFNVGVLYAQGLGVKKDLTTALGWYRRAANKGYAPAQFNLGSAYKRGEGVEKNPAEVVAWWKKAAENDHVQAQYNLGTLYYLGQGVTRDLDEARRWIEAAARQGDSRAANLLVTLSTPAAEPAAGSEFKAEGEKQEIAGSQIPAKEKKPVASAPVGIRGPDWVMAQPKDRYTIQIYADPRREAAIDFIRTQGLEKLAAYFHADRAEKPWHKVIYGIYANAPAARDAVTRLAPVLRRRAPWVRSFAAIRLEIKAALETPPKTDSKPTLSDRAAAREVKRRLGIKRKFTVTSSTATNTISPNVMLRQAQVAFNAQEYKRAVKLWRPLAEKGVAAAQYGMGFLYESGWGVDRNYNEAFDWYLRASKQGQAKAQFNLGMLYLAGRGVESSASLGLYWIQNAADSGDRRALEYFEANRSEAPVENPERPGDTANTP